MAVYFTYVYIETNHWIANNVIAVCFAIYSIENWQVGNFKILAIVFISLIMYDTYFVYGSDVMMTVAQGISLPIKILMPSSSNPKAFSMIGIGDIVIPGLMSSMCIRCDLIKTFN